MDNYLDSGGVLPSGLLSGNDTAEKIAGFNKTYRNTSLRLGIVSNIYPVSNFNNFSKLSTEYDVSVFEQNEDRGSTIITYKNCISSDPLGSIADFLDKNLRNMTQNSNPFGQINTSNQNGATVLLLCLDGVSEKAIVIGGLPHPDRQNTLLSSQPYLEGEYNGVNIKINTDGSTALTFNGATDNDGDPTNPSQGITTFQIKADGSFQFMHSTVDILADKSGALTITAKGDASITCHNANVTASGDTNLTATGTTTVKSEFIILNKQMSGVTTQNSHYSVVDFLTGIPVIPSTSTFGDV